MLWIQQVADLLNRSPNSKSLVAREGRPSRITVIGSLRFPRKQLRAWIAANSYEKSRL